MRMGRKLSGAVKRAEQDLADKDKDKDKSRVVTDDTNLWNRSVGLAFFVDEELHTSPWTPILEYFKQCSCILISLYL